jgi:hypothetical protein
VESGRTRTYRAAVLSPTPMKLYEGTRTREGTVVTADDRPLDLRHDLRNHSPDGYAELTVMLR